MTDVVVVITTFPASGDAEQFASRLVEEQLAACVNILPSMRSIYRWKNVIESADERQLIIKTTLGCLPALEKMVTTLHPYEVPEFLVLPVNAGSVSYLAWISETLEAQRLKTSRP